MNLAGAKRRGAHKHCEFHGCNSDNQKNVCNVTFIKFPQPCANVKTFRTKPTIHHIKMCERCAKCHLWLEKCARKDGRFQQIIDIKKYSCLCSKHFVKESLMDKYPYPLPEDVVSILNNSEKASAHNHSETIETEVIQPEELGSDETMRLESLEEPKINSVALYSFIKTLENDSDKCCFYTGMTYIQLENVFCILYSNEDNINYIMPHLEELVLTLIRLKRGVLIQDLRYMFNLSQILVFQAVRCVILHMYQQFSKARPFLFQKNKDFRIILDSTEFTCRNPNDKTLNRFKILIGCTPNGEVNFVSDLYEAPITNKQLLENSKLVDLLEDGDLVVTDLDQDNISSFIKGRHSLTMEEYALIKETCSKQLYIEQIIKRLKKFMIFRHVIASNMRDILYETIFVCACLLNHQSSDF